MTEAPWWNPHLSIQAKPELRGLIHRVVHASSLCLTLARSGLDEAGHLQDAAQGTSLRNALSMLLLSMEGS